MSPEVLTMLRDMLLRQQISVADPNLVPLATLAGQALAELDAELAQQQPDPDGR